MSQFSRLKYTQLIIFCLYWFVFFPIIWFVVKPELFVSSIWYTLLFALILLLVYYLLYQIIKHCCRRKESSQTPKSYWPQYPSRRGDNKPVYSSTTKSDDEGKRESRVLMPDAVMYENIASHGKKDGLVCQKELLEYGEGKNVRFITSCSLYYDGHNFK